MVSSGREGTSCMWDNVPSPLWSNLPYLCQHLYLCSAGLSMDSTCGASWASCSFGGFDHEHREIEGSESLCFPFPQSHYHWLSLGERKSGPPDTRGIMLSPLTPEFSSQVRLKLPGGGLSRWWHLSPLFWPPCFSHSLNCLPWEHFLNNSLAHKFSSWHLLLGNLTESAGSSQLLLKTLAGEEKKVGNVDVFTLW